LCRQHFCSNASEINDCASKNVDGASKNVGGLSKNVGGASKNTGGLRMKKKIPYKDKKSYP
jgi:hypothetical protein